MSATEIEQNKYTDISDIATIIKFISRFNVEDTDQHVSNKEAGRLAADALTLHEHAMMFNEQEVGYTNFLNALVGLDKTSNKTLLEKINGHKLSEEEQKEYCLKLKKGVLEFAGGFMDELIKGLPGTIAYTKVVGRLHQANAMPSKLNMQGERQASAILFYRDHKGRKQNEKICGAGKFGKVFAEISRSGEFVGADKTARNLIKEKKSMNGKHESWGEWSIVTKEHYDQHGEPSY